MQLMDELIEKVSTIVQETQDSIIIDAIYPFAQTVEYKISKEELREAILKYYGKHEHVKHGHWISTGGDYPTCSCCNGVGLGYWKACPRCTAVMDEVEE